MDSRRAMKGKETALESIQTEHEPKAHTLRYQPLSDALRSRSRTFPVEVRALLDVPFEHVIVSHCVAASLAAGVTW